MSASDRDSTECSTSCALEPPIDFANLNHLYGDDVGLHQMLLGELEGILPHYYDKLQAAIATANMAQISYEAHRMKGALSMVAVRKIPGLCKVLEDAAEVQNLKQINVYAAEIETQMKSVLAFLEHYGQDKA